MSAFDEDAYRATVRVWPDNDLCSVYAHTLSCNPPDTTIQRKCLDVMREEILRRIPKGTA